MPDDRAADTFKQSHEIAIPAKPPSLVAVAIAGESRAYALPIEGRVTVGRGAEAAFAIDDRSVSRVHASLHIGAELTVEDHGSTNGTFVGGRRLEHGGRARLRIGDALQLGSVPLVILPCTWSPALDAAGAPPALEAASGDAPIVADPTMLRLHGMASRAAQTDISVLLIGETGCGKEIFAEAIHQHSARHARPFLCVHSAALPEPLLESELFGHEKGAFTGASMRKPGLLEDADGGTVFFDEIGDMPPGIQAKLLRVLEDRRVARLGGLRGRPIDVRFVAATNRNLAEDVRTGRFRADLFYRLNGIRLEIPPLRLRPAEIEPMARLFLRRFAPPGATPRLAPAALERLHRHAWPGNVRELRNAMQRALILACGAAEIGPEDLPLDDAVTGPAQLAAPPAAPAPASERERIVAALTACAGNQSAAARLLGVSRRVLTRRIQRFGLPQPRQHGEASSSTVMVSGSS